MDYITRFYTTAEFTVAEPNLARPHVSLTKDNYVVHYMPVASQGGSNSGSGSGSSSNQHDYVEIGGIKWATCNVGAENPWDTGLYFQWGDTQGYTASQVGDGEGQKHFGLEDYKYAQFDQSAGSGSGSGGGDLKMTKYNEIDGKTILDPSDDAVTAAWGGSWRMPTTEEYVALGNAVNTEWTTDYQDSGVRGLVCTDKNDSSKTLFFPICGYCLYGSVNDISVYGRYWSSSLANDSDLYAYRTNLTSGDNLWCTESPRYYGLIVRGVLDELTGSGSGSGNE